MLLHLLDHDIVLGAGNTFDFQFQQLLGHGTGFKNRLQIQLVDAQFNRFCLGPYKMAGIFPSRRRTLEGPLPTASRWLAFKFSISNDRFLLKNITRTGMLPNPRCNF
jgi:hypothetical protein